MADRIIVQNAGALKGQVTLSGAKNAVLPIMASLILTSGVSRLKRVPASHDVFVMIDLLTQLGARVTFDKQKGELVCDTSLLGGCAVSPDVMKRMRASILAMGPLLARFKRAEIAMPGGCVIGTRPIDFHLRAFSAMGATVVCEDERVLVFAKNLVARRFILDYPSVGATENILMAAVLVAGKTEIANAAIEPEVLDLITVLRKMGARIDLAVPSMIVIHGVETLKPIEHNVILDRLEAGTFLLAAAATGGELYVPEIDAEDLELFLQKLRDMGHEITVGTDGKGIRFKAVDKPEGISFKTMPHPGFPTDLQSPMSAVLCCARGKSVVCETVFENRMHHIIELRKMGAQITLDGNTATINGVDMLHGAAVVASDIRAGAALIIAGLAAEGTTVVTGIHHLDRGYDRLEEKLRTLGACIKTE